MQSRKDFRRQAGASQPKTTFLGWRSCAYAEFMLLAATKNMQALKLSK